MSTINPADYAHMGLEEFTKAIADGTLPPATVLAVLDSRIAKRQATGKGLIPKIVAFRNQLATQLGQAEMPMPNPGKAKAAAAPVSTSGTPSEIADQLIDSGVDIAQLIVELTKRMSFKA